MTEYDNWKLQSPPEYNTPAPDDEDPTRPEPETMFVIRQEDWSARSDIVPPPWRKPIWRYKVVCQQHLLSAKGNCVTTVEGRPHEDCEVCCG